MICLEWTLRAKSLSKTNTCQNSGKVFSPRSTSSGNLVRPSDMSVNSISTFRLLEHIFLMTTLFQYARFLPKRSSFNYMYIENNPGIYERKKVRFSNFLFLVDSVVKILFFFTFFLVVSVFSSFFPRILLCFVLEACFFFLKTFHL